MFKRARNNPSKSQPEAPFPAFWSSPSEAKVANLAKPIIAESKPPKVKDKAESKRRLPRLADRVSESAASKHIHRLIYCDGRLQTGGSRLCADWHMGRQRFLVELDALMGHISTVHHAHRGHLLLAHQLLHVNDDQCFSRHPPKKTVIGRCHQPAQPRQQKRRAKLAAQLLQQLWTLEIPVNAPLTQEEHQFLEHVLSTAETVHGQSYLHQPPINRAAKQLMEAFNTLQYTMHAYLAQCVCDLRNKRGRKRYRTVWQVLRNDAHLQSHYLHFLRSWTQFTHLYLLEQVGRRLNCDTPHLGTLLRSAAKQWDSTAAAQTHAPARPEFAILS